MQQPSALSLELQQPSPSALLLELQQLSPSALPLKLQQPSPSAISEAQSEASNTPDEDDSFDNRSEVSSNTSAIPKVIRGTFASFPQVGRQPQRARAKRSWIWDWGIRSESKGLKTWTCTLYKSYNLNNIY